MVLNCAVKNCSSKYPKDGIAFFRIPATPGISSRLQPNNRKLKLKQRKSWLRAMKLPPLSDEKTARLRICAKHFVHGCPASYNDENDIDWIPSIDMGYKKPKFTENIPLILRRPRIRNHDDEPDLRINAFQSNSVASVMDVSCSIDNIDEPVPLNNISMTDTIPLSSNRDFEGNTSESQCYLSGTSTDCSTKTDFSENKVEISVQTDISGNYTDALEVEVLAQSSCVAQLRKENAQLKQQLEKLSWSESTFEDDPKKITYYTGLPNLAMFRTILEFISSSLENLRVPECNNFQKLLLTCMKLRHNTSFKGLGYRFDIDMRDASYIFKNVIVILYEAFPYVVHWPERESLKRRIPECFRKQYGEKVATIIDCFEISCEKSATSRARAQTYSPYKGKNTIKYLLGITPHGFISFISDGYAEQVTDKFIAENCSILDNLLPGDIVLADCGFTVYEMVAMKYASSNISAPTRGVKQLHRVEIEKTQKIASVRIHVKRIIGQLRNKFSILTHRVPMHFFKERHHDKILLDIIVHVCCAFINFCDPVVPLKKTNVSKKCSR